MRGVWHILAAAAAAMTLACASMCVAQLNVQQWMAQHPAKAVGSPTGDSTVAPQRSDSRPRLELPSGDFLPGELVDSAEPGTIAWQCDAMLRPFVYPLDAVRYVHFPRPPAEGKAPGKFCVELAGGDVLYGDLVSLSDDAAVIDSPQFGTLSIDRGELRSIQRTDAVGGIAYSGPNGVADWQELDGSGAWREESGTLAADKPGKLRLSGVKLPGKAAIEVELSWGGRADFSLSFEPMGEAATSLSKFAQNLFGPRRRPINQANTPPVKSRYAFELAAWSDTLMLISEGAEAADVARVRRSLGGNSRVELQIYVDPDERTVAVYSLAGERLAHVALPDDAAPKTEGVLSLTNRLGDVRLERLVVRHWDGSAPGAAARDAALVQLSVGEPIVAESLDLAAGGERLTIAAPEGSPADDKVDGSQDSPSRQVALADVVRISFPLPKAPRKFAMRASQMDGVRVSGELMKIDGGKLTIERPGVRERFILPVAELRSLASLRGGWPQRASEGLVGRLEIAGGIVSGALVADDSKSSDGDGDKPHALVWQPSGSQTASPLKPSAAGRIVYRERPATPPPTPEATGNVQPPRPAGVFGGVLQALGAAGAAGGSRGLVVGDQLLWLKAGDRIPCRVEAIDERGVRFSTPLVESTFVPHSAVKAWDAVAGSRPRDIAPKAQSAATPQYYAVRRLGNQPEADDPQKYIRLLTLPRMQRSNPPTHLIESTRGDFLRGRLVAMDDQNVTIEVRTEPKRIPRASVTRIIWLDNPNARKATSGDATKAADAAQVAAEANQMPETPDRLEVQAVRSDGVRLTFCPERLADNALVGSSDLLGACRVDLAMIDELIIGGAIADAAAGLVYSDWRLRPAPDPRFMAEDGGEAPGSNAGLESAMVGQPAPDFTLESSAGEKFQLSGAQGRVIVLDFWASWCGPCKAAMPQIRDALADFDAGQVEWIAVNLQEDQETAAKALERVGVSPRVAYDIDGAAAEKYEVTAIPHTAVVDPQGKVTAVFVGASPKLADELRAAVERALEEADE